MKKIFFRYVGVLRRERERIFVFGGMCLVGVLAFEAGTMTASSIAAEPIVVEVPALQATVTEGVIAGASAAAPRAVPAEGKANCPLVGSRNSDLYHLPTCAPAKRIKPENVVCFASPEEAKERGYRPGCLK